MPFNALLANESIPFEIHLTIKNLSKERQGLFVDFCMQQNAKPLLIELAKGDFIHQPMLSKVVYEKELANVLSTASVLSNELMNEGLEVKRLKIEIPSDNWALFQNHKSEHYFEWHGKIPYERVNELLMLCQKHQVHLSFNALRNASDIRFITLREHGNKEQFESRISALKVDLETNNWPILKQQSEYCIYDNHQFLDHGWLS